MCVLASKEKGPTSRGMWGPPEAETFRKGTSPRASRRNTEGPCQTCDTMNLCCCQPLRVWCFVRAAAGSKSRAQEGLGPRPLRPRALQGALLPLAARRPHSTPRPARSELRCLLHLGASLGRLVALLATHQCSPCARLGSWSNVRGL